MKKIKDIILHPLSTTRLLFSRVSGYYMARRVKKFVEKLPKCEVCGQPIMIRNWGQIARFHRECRSKRGGKYNYYNLLKK